MYSYGPPHMAKQKQDNQLELTYSSYVKTQDVTLKTCQRRWMIGRSGERGSGISVLAAHDDDDDDKVSSKHYYLEGILTNTTTLGQSGPGSNGNSEVLYTSQVFGTRALPLDAV